MQGRAFFIRKMAWDIDGKNENIGAVALDSAEITYSKAPRVTSAVDCVGASKCGSSFFILHRAILVTSVVRYTRKEILVFIVSTISR